MIVALMDEACNQIEAALVAYNDVAARMHADQMAGAGAIDIAITRLEEAKGYAYDQLFALCPEEDDKPVA